MEISENLISQAWPGRSKLFQPAVLENRLKEHGGVPVKNVTAYLNTIKTNGEAAISLLQLLDNGSLEARPPLTTALFDAIREKLLQKRIFSSPARLKSAFFQSGLFFDQAASSGQSFDPSYRLTHDFKYLLLLLSSLVHSRTPARQSFSAARQMKAYSLHANASCGKELALLSCLADESLEKISLQQRASAEESGQEKNTWFFELPMQFQAEKIMVPFLVSREQKDKAREGNYAADTQWSVSFSLKSPGSGLLHARIVLEKNSVSVKLRTDNERYGGKVLSGFSRLQRKFAHSGLQLKECSCRLLTGESSLHE